MIITKLYFDKNIDESSEKEVVLSNLLKTENLHIKALDKNIEIYSNKKKVINNIITSIENLIEKLDKIRSNEKEEKIYLKYSKLINLLITEKIYYSDMKEKYARIIEGYEEIKELKSFQLEVINDINKF